MKEYNLCKYFFNCPVSKISNRDCIYTDCKTKDFYNKYGINYLENQNEKTNNIKIQNQRRKMHP